MARKWALRGVIILLTLFLSHLGKLSAAPTQLQTSTGDDSVSVVYNVGNPPSNFKILMAKLRGS